MDLLTRNIQLGSGVYTVTITDNKGCTATSGARIIEPAALTVLTSISDVSCFGLNNGSVNLTVLGGTSPFSYNWSDGTSSKNISGVYAGNYAVTITDDNGCLITEGVSIFQPSEINISAVVTNLPCFGGNTGAIDLSVTGGTPAYAFAWSNNATTEDIDQLTADAYTVTVTDDNGCSEIFSRTVSQSGTLQIMGSTIDVTCNGLNDGAITITASGGTPGYSYNWSSGDSSQSATNLPAGIYHVTISDANGCIIVTTDTITEPAPLDIFTDVSNITCFGSANGSVDLTVHGGSMPYSYNWSNGSTVDSLTGLSAGELSVTVTDDHFCTATASASVDEADSISVTADIINVSSLNSHDGSISLNVNGGTPGYHFEWSNGSNSQEIFNLPGGTFCVSVTDDQSCSVSKCYVVNEPVSVIEKEILEEFNASFSGESLFIHLRLNAEMECKIQVLDISGKLLAIRNPGKISVLNIEIPGNELSSGLLLINVVTEKGSLTRKVVAVR